MIDTDSPSEVKPMILACSGGSNVGQLANRAAVDLTTEGFGAMFCLAGIGAHLNKFVKSAQDSPAVIAIDGCPIGCVKELLEHADIKPAAYFVLTELGIEKNKRFELDPKDVASVIDTVKDSWKNKSRS
jgi:uncharacterized metal-binding protein